MEKAIKTGGSVRNARGSALAEFAPSLLILFLYMFCPLVNLVSLAVGFGACMHLNHAQVREAALLPRSAAEDPNGRVRKGIPEQWKASGLGRFVSPVAGPDTTLTYRRTEGLDDDMVTVTTSVEMRPTFTLPFFNTIPGLGAPVAFRFSTQRFVENSVTGR